MPDQESLLRLRQKLEVARQTDAGLKVFGSVHHEYVLRDPIKLGALQSIERHHAIRLPAGYRDFLLEMGNGGAGPFYGLYALDQAVPELSNHGSLVGIANRCLLVPRMPKAQWQALLAKHGWGTGTEGYRNVCNRIFGGLLALGSQGCSYFHCLVLNGAHAGRVVNIDLEMSAPPKFAFEPDFLAWYERWLDEIIEGDLQEGPSWFGYVKGGSEQALLAELQAATDAEDITDCLDGLLGKRRLQDGTLQELVTLHAGLAPHRRAICHVVAKSDHVLARPLLAALAVQDPCAFFQGLHWYARDHIGEWQDAILAAAGGMTDVETFRFFTYVLEPLAVEKGSYLAPYTKSSDPEIRKTAFYALGKMTNRVDYLDCFIAGLHDPEPRVVHGVVQALKGVTERKLLPHYQAVAERFEEDTNYILSNLKYCLAEFAPPAGQEGWSEAERKYSPNHSGQAFVLSMLKRIAGWMEAA